MIAFLLLVLSRLREEIIILKKIQELTKESDKKSFLELTLIGKKSPLLRVVTH